MNPTLSRTEVKDILLNTKDPTPTLSGLYVSGGRLNLNNALESTPLLPWFDINEEERTGTIGPDSSTNINVNFSAETADTGTYNGNIAISFDDFYQSIFTIPVELTVE